MRHAKKVLALSVAAAALGIGMSGVARAEVSYGVSYQNITNGQVLFTDFQGIPTPGTGVLSGGTTTATTNASLTGNAPQGDSQTLPRGSVPPADAACSTIGIACTNNAFTSAVLSGIVGDYSRGDAQVVSEQLVTTGVFAATNFAEYHLDDIIATAGSSGGVGSTTGFTLEFTIAGGTADFSVQFNNDPFMQIFLDALSGGSATANITAVLTLTQTAGANPNRNFVWRPDGIGANATAPVFASGILAETDPYSLNEGLSTVGPIGAPFIYDPTGGGYAGGPNGFWLIGLDNLQAGTYSLNLELEERSRGNLATQQVPEPGTLALAGMALLMAAGLGRRRKS